MSASSSPKSSSMGIKSFWALSGLSALGIAQPLLDLLGKNPQFLTVHHFSRFDLVLLVLLLTLVPAVFLGFLSWLAGLFNERLGKAVLLCSVTILLAIMIAPMVNGLLPLPGLVLVTISFIIAFLVAWKIGGNPKLQSYWSLLGFIPLLVAGLFFSHSGPRSIAFPKTIDSEVGGQQLSPPKADIPIVMVVFDAFPTNSIMNQDHEIDEALCPNLADLNHDAVWYKNALSISDDTLVAVPAILTGLHPLPGQQPNLVSHPNNLFSWLKPWRTIHPLESHTHLNGNEFKPSISERWQLTTSDLRIIFLHSVLPRDLATGLPSITHDWLNFADPKSSDSQHAMIPYRVKLFDDFLSTISTGEKGDCYFLHILVPHTPYQFLPSGRHYTIKGKEPSGEGMQFGNWSEDPRAVVHSQQRLLLQVGYSDYLVGRIVDQLKEAGIYNDAMIIITADHGMSFTPGDSRRQLSSTNRGDILPVPLFIKYPGYGNGSTDDRVIQSIDIMPTIATVLESPLPWRSDGHDLMDSSYKGHSQTRYLGAASNLESVEYDTGEILAQRDASIITKLERFPLINGKMALSAPFRGSELIGNHVPLNIPKWDQWSISMGGDSLRTFSNSLKDIMPGEVQGLISGEVPLSPQWDIAVLVDRKIAAFTRPFKEAGHSDSEIWSTLLPEEFMVPGEHHLETVLVNWSQDTPEFFSLGQQELSAIGKNLILDTMFVSWSSGLYTMATWGKKPAVWTKGAATISLKLPGSETPSAVKLTVLAAPPKGSILIAFANGTLLGVEQLSKFPWTGVFDLTPADIQEQLDLTFFSTTFIPSEVNPKVSDNRVLGLALSLVELQGNDFQMQDQDESKPNLDKPISINLTPDESGSVPWNQVHKTETWQDGPATWTKGQASCQTAWPQPEAPRFLLVEIVGTDPDGSSLKIKINDTEVAAKANISGNWTQLIDISEVPLAEQLKVAITSSTFKASKGQAAQEGRELGVALRQVILVQ
jgi:hypothetical protein